MSKASEERVDVDAAAQSVDANEANVSPSCARELRSEPTRESVVGIATASRSTTEDVLALVSHELRQPVNAIVGWADLLATSRPITDARRDTAVAVIAMNARALVRILDDLLTTSSSLLDKLTLNPTPTDLAATIRMCVESVRCAAESKGVELVCTCEEGLGTIVVDEGRVAQILSNLLSNALKFTDPGGEIDVAARRTEDGVLVSVHDTGVGIAPESVPHVFERYWQEEYGLRGPRPGLGVGLSVVRQLVECHGGSVEVSSAGRGKGATFEVRLPRIPPCL